MEIGMSCDEIDAKKGKRLLGFSAAAMTAVVIFAGVDAYYEGPRSEPAAPTTATDIALQGGENCSRPAFTYHDNDRWFLRLPNGCTTAPK
jgi:hypothetical protein